MHTRTDPVCPTCDATNLRHLSHKTKGSTVTESAYCTNCGTRLTLEYELKAIRAEPVDAESDPGLALSSRHVWDVCRILKTDRPKEIPVDAGTRDESGRWPMADLPEHDSVSVRTRLFRKKDPANAPQAKPEYLVETVSAKRRMIAYVTGLERGVRRARYAGGDLRVGTHVLFERVEARTDGSLTLHGCKVRKDKRHNRQRMSYVFDRIDVGAPHTSKGANAVRSVEATCDGRCVNKFEVEEGDDFLYTAVERLFQDEADFEKTSGRSADVKTIVPDDHIPIEDIRLGRNILLDLVQLPKEWRHD